MSAPVWYDHPAAAVAPADPDPGARPPHRPWFKRRSLQVAIGAAAVAVMAVADWPHQATSGQRVQDLATLEKQVDGQQASCSLGAVATITAYDQIVTGQSTDRATAISLAEQSSLDCQPDGNPQLLDLTTNSAPRDLSSYQLDAAIGRAVDWAFPNGAAVCTDLAQLLSKGPNPALLADARTRLATMSSDAAAVQQTFNAAAHNLGAPNYTFAAMGEVSPGSVVR